MAGLITCEESDRGDAAIADSISHRRPLATGPLMIRSRVKLAGSVERLHESINHACRRRRVSPSGRASRNLLDSDRS
jgi:hypothetical protein